MILLFSRDCHMIAITLSPSANNVFSCSLCNVFIIIIIIITLQEHTNFFGHWNVGKY